MRCPVCGSDRRWFRGPIYGLRRVVDGESVLGFVDCVNRWHDDEDER